MHTMHTLFTRFRSATIASLFCFALLPLLPAATWYVDQAAAGTGTGTSRANAWTSFAAINQAGLNAGDVVLVYAGTYDERFIVTRGGTAANARITYKGVGSPVLRGIQASAINFVAIIGLEFTQPSNAYNYASINLSNCSGWLIQDNYFHDTYSDGINGAFNTVNSNNIVRRNTFSNINGTGGGAGGSGVTISMYGHSNLIEYNTILKSLDRVRAFGTGNVVRNNFFGATDTSFYPNASPFPFHSDGFQSFQSSLPLVKLLFEKNFDMDNRDTVGGATNNPNGHGLIVQDSVGTNGLNWYVIRFNLLVREAEAAMILQSVNKVRFYNNTIVQMGADNTTNFHSAIAWNAGNQDDYDFRNNTFPFNPRMIDANGIITTSNRPTNFTSAANHSFNLSTQVVLPAGASPANLPQVDPQFTDGTGVAGHDNYTLRTGSPLRNAAAAITTAVGLGINQTALQVADAKRLFDGWGVADADFIKIGTGAYVQIASIDYATNVVTLSAPRTWSNGDAVVVKGTEDVGALPYSYAGTMNLTNTTAINLAAGPVNLTATTTTPDAIRMVEFLVDGIPVGIDYDAPYSVAWTADGAAHDVEARAYNAWASQTLVLRKFNTGPIFTTQPTSQQVSTGTTVVFSATVTAPSAPTFQWQKNGLNISNGGTISGATTNTLTITGATPADAGTYTLVATNSVASDTSNGATLLVDAVAPSFTLQPAASQSVNAGSTVNFTVTASGTPAPTFQWKKNGSNLANGGNVSGATSATLTLTNVTAADSGTYTVVADNTVPPAATSNNAVLVVNGVAPSISVSPSSQTILIGNPVTFSVVAGGTAPLSYQWQKGGTNIVGATSSSYTIPSVQSGDAGTYAVVVSNFAGSATSGTATLTVTSTPPPPPTPPPTITTQPVGTTVVSGRTASLHVTASGATGYQWQVSNDGGNTWTAVANDSTYSGATTSTLTVAGANDGLNNLLFRALAINAGGFIATSATSLAVTTPVLISPTDVLTSSDGRILVSDASTNVIQSIASDGVATVLAGIEGLPGAANSSATTSSFRQPAGLALQSGNMFIADSGNSLVRKLGTDNQVTTIAGSDANQSFKDGTGSDAWFNLPVGIVADTSGNLYVADTGNSVIRKITPAGVVTTLAGSAGSRGSANGTGSAARFNQPTGIAIDASGNLYVADTLNQTIRQVTSGGVVTTVAGVAGVAGTDDGPAAIALFNRPWGVVLDSSGNIYVSDSGSSTIRKISPSRTVTTLAGLPTVSGQQDGTGLNALFNQPMGLRFDSAGVLYVVDNGNATIRRVTPAGVVTTMAIRRATPVPSTPSTPTVPETPPPLPTLPPVPSTGGGGGGGGGGVPSTWFIFALLAAAAIRYRKNF